MDQKPLNEVTFTFKCTKSIKNAILPMEDRSEYRIETDLRIGEDGQYIGQNEGARALYCRILPKENNVGLKIFHARRSQGMPNADKANYDAAEEAAKKEFDFLRDLKGAKGHAPSVFAYGEISREDGSQQWAIIEEHVEGLTLVDYISHAAGGDHESLDAEQTLWLGLRIAEACDACYIREHESAQVTHRDLSPDNLRFCTSEDGRELDRVVLLDFGNAVHATRQECTPTWKDRDLAKVKYGGPEMFDDVTRNATVSDTWAIGAIMHYARTLRVPFEDELKGYTEYRELNGSQCKKIREIKSNPKNPKNPVDLKAVLTDPLKIQKGVKAYSAENLDDLLCRVVSYATLTEVDQSKHDSRLTVSSLYRLLFIATGLLVHFHDQEQEIQCRLKETEKELENCLKGRQKISKDFCASPEALKQRKHMDTEQNVSNGWVRYTGVSRNDPCPCGSGKKFKICHGRFSRWPQVVAQREGARGSLLKAAFLLGRHFEEALLGPTLLLEADLNRPLDYGILAKERPAIGLASNYAKLEAVYEARRLSKLSRNCDHINDYLNAASVFRNSAALLTRTADSKSWDRFALVAYQLICEHFAFYSNDYFTYDVKQFRTVTGIDVKATAGVLNRVLPSNLSQTWAKELIDLLKEANNCYVKAINLLANYWSKDSFSQ